VSAPTIRKDNVERAYVWTWGSGADADSFTVDVSGTPEASTWAMMVLGFAALGFAGSRASRKSAALSQ
jgi:hypothetical protein